MRLTKLIVDRAVYSGSDGQRYVVWDSEISGFGVRVFPSGKKSFVLSYRSQGRKRLLTLGRYGPITLDQARALARRHSNKVFGLEH